MGASYECSARPVSCGMEHSASARQVLIVGGQWAIRTPASRNPLGRSLRAAPQWRSFRNGAEDEIRTRDPRLGTWRRGARQGLATSGHRSESRSELSVRTHFMGGSFPDLRCTHYWWQTMRSANSPHLRAMDLPRLRTKGAAAPSRVNCAARSPSLRSFLAPFRPRRGDTLTPLTLRELRMFASKHPFFYSRESAV
jgi:hypothetical protein